MKLIEIWYYIWNTPYIEFNIMKDTRIIATIIHKIPNSADTGHIEIQWKKKYGWFILPNNSFTKKNKFIAYGDLENCIPLIEDTKLESTSTDIIITEKTIATLKKAGVKIIDYTTDKSGRQKIFKSAVIPPTVFHQMMSAHFVREGLRNPPSKWEELKWAIIAAVAGLVIIAVIWMMNGAPKPM